jgi:hypothetical protein
MFGLLHIIYDLFESRQVPGGALEIGVHHGKFFIALNGLVDAGHKSVALDLFDQQELNIDYSGSASQQHFSNHLSRFDRHKGANVVIKAGDSISISPDSLLKLSGCPFKLISIDGGHTAEHTISDILLADKVLDPFGFIFVDDILNSHWLGVVDGVTAYLRTNPRLWPLTVGYNKMIMCRMSVHNIYRAFFQEKFNFTKSTKLCGYEVLAV